MSRKTIIAGNWKMNPDPKAATKLIKDLSSVSISKDVVDVIVCPPTLYLQEALLLQSHNIHIGAQTISEHDNGAYTGELSASMLTETGIQFSIVGHSERRLYFGENNIALGQKLAQCFKHNITPIYCIGETEEENENKETETVLKQQLNEALKHLTHKNAEGLIIAYEPVWAIGTGKVASKEYAEKTHAFIRTELAHIFSNDIADKIRILYGGSVNPNNATDLLSCQNIDGALIGGASLSSESFEKIISMVD